MALCLRMSTKERSPVTRHKYLACPEDHPMLIIELFDFGRKKREADFSRDNRLTADTAVQNTQNAEITRLAIIRYLVKAIKSLPPMPKNYVVPNIPEFAQEGWSQKTKLIRFMLEHDHIREFKCPLTGNKTVDDMNANLTIFFGQYGNKATRDNEDTKTTICIDVSSGKLGEELTPIEAIQIKATTFYHEYQHYIDFEAGIHHKYKQPTWAGKLLPDISMKRYANDPMEVRAWSLNVAEPLLRMMRDGKAKRVNSDFKKYFTNQLRYETGPNEWGVFLRMNGENQQLVLKLLYELHKAVKSLPMDATPEEKLSLKTKLIRKLDSIGFTWFTKNKKIKVILN